MADVTLGQIDQAFFDVFGATWVDNESFTQRFTMDVGDRAVAIFIGSPVMTENTENRIFPAICIELLGPPEADDNLQYINNDPKGIIADNSGAANPTRTYGENARAFLVDYRIHTFARNARDDRDLMTKVLSVITTRGVLEVNGSLWHYFQRRTGSMNRFLEDQFVYHRYWDIEIQVNIAFDGSETLPVITSTDISGILT